METNCNISKNNEKNCKKIKFDAIKAILGGAICGFINGMFGGGGGMIVVPLLSLVIGLEVKKAHATAILIILPLSIVSAIFYLIFGAFDLSVTLPVGGGVIAGGILGALLLKKLSSKWIVIIFSVVMAIAGVKMTFF